VTPAEANEATTPAARPATSVAELDRAIEAVRARAAAFARLEPGARAALLRECIERTAVVAEAWARAAAAAKGLDWGTPAGAEDWLTGPMLVVRNARLLAGSLDAGTISPPISVKARKAGLRQIADVSGTPSVQSAVLTTRAYAAREAATTASFVKAWTEAIAVIHRDKEFTLKVIGQYTRSDDPEIVEETYRTMAPHFKRAPHPPLEVIQTYLNELGQKDERVKRLRVEDLVDTRFVRQLEQSGFIAELYR